jgi:hypothetical protein
MNRISVLKGRQREGDRDRERLRGWEIERGREIGPINGK